MKRFLSIFFVLSITYFAKGQRIENDTICIKDTVLVQGIWTYPKNFQLPDSTDSFLATYCYYKKSFGLRFDFGFSQYIYSKSTADWIGYHQGTNINFAFAYKKLNFGARFKPWTTKPKSELSFDNKILPENAEVNPLKFDIYLGYEIDLSNVLSIEPSIGYTMCRFKVINEDKINESFSFNSTNGLLIGMTVNKYIPLDNFMYFVLFGRVNYGLVDYSEIHSKLSGGYYEICIGISYKFFWKGRVYNKIEK